MLHVCAWKGLQVGHYWEICILIALTPAAYIERMCFWLLAVIPNQVPTVSTIRF